MIPLSFRRKVGSSAVALVLLAAATSPLWTVIVIKRQAAQILDDSLPGLVSSALANANVSEAFFELSAAVLSDNPQSRQQSIGRIVAITKETDLHLDEYATVIESPEDRRNFERLIEVRNRYRATRNQVIELLSAGRVDEAVRLFREFCLPQYRAYTEALSTLVKFNVEEARVRGSTISSWSTFLLVTQGVLVLYFLIYGFVVPFSLFFERTTRNSRVVPEI